MANKTGKGGFKDNPGNINKDGRPQEETTWAKTMDAALAKMAGNSGMSRKQAIIGTWMPTNGRIGTQSNVNLTAWILIQNIPT